jgi:probable rRNA maturation factor
MIVSIDVDDQGWSKVPALEDLTRKAVDATAIANGASHDNLEIAVLFTDDQSVAKLNGEWRGKPVPTNVLSFPAGDFEVPGGEAIPLGDLVLASGVVAREAADQGKTLPQHATHLIVHGLLHLLGHDHETEEEAVRMESLETAILKGLGISDPYERQ